MKVLVLAAVLALGDEPTSTVVVELGNVCGRDCVASPRGRAREDRRRQGSQVYGDKFHFSLAVTENKSVLPSTIVKVLDKIRTDSKGEEDFPLEEFVATLSGGVEKQGDGLVFTARASGQKFSVKPNEALSRLLAAGASKVTLTGKVTEAKAGPVLEVSEAAAAK